MPERAHRLRLATLVRLPGRSLVLLSAAAVVAAAHGPKRVYQHESGLRLTPRGPLRLVALLRDAVGFAAIDAARLLALAVRERRPDPTWGIFVRGDVYVR